MQRALLLLLIAVSYVLFGGAPSWTLPPLLILAFLAFFAAPKRTLHFQPVWRPLDVALVAFIAGLALQVTPLPADVVHALSPRVSGLRSALSLQPPGLAAAWHYLSIDPAATRQSLATAVLGISTFWIARGLFSAGGSTRQFCRMLALIGAIAAASAPIFRAVAPGLILGVMQPSVRSANPIGAFVNRNHFAGWLLLVLGPVCGYLLAHLRTHPSYRGVLSSRVRQFLASGALLNTIALMLIVGVLLLTLSRSGLAGLGTAAICGWALGRGRLRFERTSSIVPAFAVAGAGLLLLVLFVDINGWATRIQESLDTSANAWSRLMIWREAMPIVRDFWLTGTGGGTFGDAMVSYQQTRIWVGSMSQWAHFNDAHSHYVQLVTEGGLLLAIPAIVAMGSLFVLGLKAVRQDRGEMFWARIGAAGSLAGLAVQSIWETSLVMPANAILCGSVAGLLLHRRTGGRSEESTDHLPTPSPR